MAGGCERRSYGYHSLLRRFSDARQEDRQPSYRIADLHTYCEAALSPYLHREIFSFVELILDQPAVATQSLYLE